MKRLTTILLLILLLFCLAIAVSAVDLPESAMATANLPSNGGSVWVDVETEYAFTPSSSGRWEFYTAENGGSDPCLTVYNQHWDVVAYDDDSAGNYNARIVVFLDAGDEYTIHAGFYDEGVGGYTLFAFPAIATATLPSGGGEVYATSAKEYEFKPDRSGLWVITVSGRGYDYRELSIYDRRGYTITNAWGESAVCMVFLEAGETYYVYAESESYYYGESGSYTLSAAPLTINADIPSEGGEVRVSDMSFYEFCPDRSGPWIIKTSDNGNSDPYLWIYDSFGYLINSDDDGSGNLNAEILAFFKEGETYIIRAGFYGGGSGSYTMSVASADTGSSIPGDGGELHATGSGFFKFVPDVSDLWLITLSGSSYSELNLAILDYHGDYIATDYAWSSEAAVLVRLEAGETYYIRVWSYYGSPGAYTLSIASATASPSIPGSGGEVQDTGAGLYSFSPESSTIWVLSLQDLDYDTEPYLTLYDQSGYSIVSNRWSDSLMVFASLEVGETYYIQIGFSYGRAGSYTLRVITADTSPLLPSGGGDVQIIGDGIYVFIPNQTGPWSFTTSSDDDHDDYVDPYLRIIDRFGNPVRSGYTNRGSSTIIAFLAAGETYYIFVSNYAWDAENVSYTLHTSPTVANASIPGGGGDVPISSSGVYMFNPDTSGLWAFETSTEGYVEAYFILYNDYGYEIGSWFTPYTQLTAILEAGEAYYLLVYAFYLETGSITLSVSRSEIKAPIPVNGGDVYVTENAFYEFTPDTTGVWVFRTSENGNSDPFLWLYDARGYEIAADDDTAGGLNAMIGAFLEAGQTYYIQAGYYYGGSGSYTLTVSPAPILPAPEVPGYGMGIELHLEDCTVFSFTPPETPYDDINPIWGFRISNHGESGVVLAVFDKDGTRVGYTTGSDYGIFAHLTTGEIYVVIVHFWLGSGDATLTVELNAG